MKKTLFLIINLLTISILSFSQATTIVPSGTTPHILQTGSGSKGFSHTDGTISVGTYLGAGAGWIQTHTNNPLYFTTNNGNVQMTLATNGNFGIGKIPSTTLDVLSPNPTIAKFASTGNQSLLYFYQNTNVVTGYVGTNNDFANKSFEIGTTAATGSLFLSTSSSPRLTITPTGYIKLGDNAATPAIKTKKITGITPSSQGSAVFIPHGLSESKILGIEVFVEYNAGNGGIVPHRYTSNGGFEYNYHAVAGNVVLILTDTNSSTILSKPVRILITYEE
jgi:hypothetical protein